MRLIEFGQRRLRKLIRLRCDCGEPCNSPKCGMARLQMETNLAALGDCGRSPTERDGS